MRKNRVAGRIDLRLQHHLTCGSVSGDSGQINQGDVQGSSGLPAVIQFDPCSRRFGTIPMPFTQRHDDVDTQITEARSLSDDRVGCRGLNLGATPHDHRSTPQGGVGPFVLR